MLISDTHTYVVADDRTRYPRVSDQAAWVDHAVDAEALVARMDAAGVAKATLIQALQAHGYDNSYTIDTAKRYAGRFVAIGMYDLADDETASKLQHEIEELGVLGARVTPRSLTAASAEAMWEVADAFALPVVIAAATPSAFGDIADIARRYPRARLLLEGLALTNETYEGPPFVKQKPLFDLAKHDNIYPKWCTDQLLDIPSLDWQQAFMQQVVTAFGAERVMWGSRYPYRNEWSYQAQVDAAVDVVAPLPEKDRSLILGETALRLWSELA